MRTTLVISLLVFVVLAVVSAGVAVTFMPYLGRAQVAAELAGVAPVAAKPLATNVQYFPPAPTDAPAAIRDQILLGRDLVVDTRARLPAYVGNSLSCSNCHFGGGLSPGGRNQGFSLVGVATYSPAGVQDPGLPARVANCFARNLNGHAPPADGRELSAMVDYLRWIASGLPYLAAVPWLAPRPLTSDRPPDAKAGERLEAEVCAPCHGDHGQGTQIAPATHGPASFTTASQILTAGILERFLFENMPRGNPTLDAQQAADGAAYLRAQPRPAPRP